MSSSRETTRVGWGIRCFIIRRTSWGDLMTQLGEAVTAAILTDAVAECPFKTPTPPTVDKESEDPARDDSHAVDDVQENDGGKLGRNVVAGSSGSEGTWNVLGGDPPIYQRPREDTARAGVKAH